MSYKDNSKTKKIYQGRVVSDKMDKTLVVEVVRYRMSSKYKKRYQATKRFKVDDPKKQFKTGDEVEFVVSRPLSKEKKWRVLYKK